MQTFKRFSAAIAAAEGRDIIQVKICGQTLYIVPPAEYIDSCEEISVLTQEPCRFAKSGVKRVYGGNVSPHHLKRLGNANWALNAKEIKSRLAEPDGLQKYFK